MPIMPQILNSKVLHAAVAMLAFYVPLTLFIPPQVLYVMVGSMLFTTSVAVLYSYWPPLRIAIHMSVDELERVDILTMGIFLVFLSLAGRELYVTFYRVVVVAEGIRDDEYFLMLSFFRYMAAVAAILALSSRKILMGPRIFRDIPGWPTAILATLAGILVGLAALLYT